MSSRKTALVLSSMAAPKAAGSVPSTKVVVMPILGRVCWNRFQVPPYRLELLTRLSPARARLRIESVSAAWPDANPSRGQTTFERSDALLEDVGGRVHDAGVDVAELLESEQSLGVRRVIEHVRRGGVDGYGARIGRGVDLLTCVQGLRLGTEGGLGRVVECCHVRDSSGAMSWWRVVIRLMSTARF